MVYHILLETRQTALSHVISFGGTLAECIAQQLDPGTFKSFSKDKWTKHHVQPKSLNSALGAILPGEIVTFTRL